MAGFFLIAPGSSAREAEARRVFQSKGLGEPDVFDLGGWRLLLYRKQLTGRPNFIESGGRGLYSVGTLAYRGLGHAASLERLLSDHYGNGIDRDALRGNFALLLWDGSAFDLMTDEMLGQKIFHTSDGGLWTSSFLAAINAVPGGCTLNRRALLEKLAKGYVIGPDTLVNEVLQLEPGTPSPRADLRLVPRRPLVASSEFEGSFDECARHQNEALKEYFEGIRELSGESLAEGGLSSGFDSRLVLALAHDLPGSFAVHTHATQGVSDHDLNQGYVRQMAAHYEIEMRAVPTKPAGSLSPDEMAGVMEDCLWYFDGRNNDNQGSMSQTYTPSYRRAVLGDRRLTINGIGGEIYRNYYSTMENRFAMRDWMNTRVYYRPIEKILPDGDVREDMVGRHLAKTFTRLSLPPAEIIDRHVMRRYYSEVRTPDNESTNHGAHNQLSLFLTPFAERRIVEEGYRCLRFIGASGRFQGRMIQLLDPYIAGVSSHYGHALSEEPIKPRLKSLYRGYLPHRWRSRLSETRYEKIGLFDRARKHYSGLLSKYPDLAELDQIIREAAPEADIDQLSLMRPAVANLMYVAYLLRAHGSTIRW
jgi:hypothetical protein